jgi:hypothetical protein
MTDPRLELKWFYRIALFILLIVAGYVALQPQYNFAHWIPHHFLRDIGFSYSKLLWFEQNTDGFLHFGISYLLTLLIFKSQFQVFRKYSGSLLFFLVGGQLAVEISQFYLGRGFDYSDLLYGIIGCFVAYFVHTIPLQGSKE